MTAPPESRPRRPTDLVEHSTSGCARRGVPPPTLFSFSKLRKYLGKTSPVASPEEGFWALLISDAISETGPVPEDRVGEAGLRGRTSASPFGQFPSGRRFAG